MSKKSLFNFVLLFFLFAVLFATAVSAQTNSCSVQMIVSLNNSETRIKGVTATAVNIETKKVYKSPPGGIPFFVKLPDGDYRVTVSKVGYKQTIDDYNLDCSTAENNQDVWSIELWKGNQKQIVKLYNRPAVIPPRRLDVRTIVGDSDINTTRPTAAITDRNSNQGIGNDRYS